MKATRVAVILALATAGATWTFGSARADTPVSDAAQLCLTGAQVDYYQVIGGTPASADTLPASLDGGINFLGLVHGVDDFGPYVVAANQGECVSFVAENDKGPKVSLGDIRIVKTVDVSSPSL